MARGVFRPLVRLSSPLRKAFLLFSRSCPIFFPASLVRVLFLRWCRLVSASARRLDRFASRFSLSSPISPRRTLSSTPLSHRHALLSRHHHALISRPPRIPSPRRCAPCTHPLNPPPSLLQQPRRIRLPTTPKISLSPLYHAPASLSACHSNAPFVETLASLRSHSRRAGDRS